MSIHRLFGDHLAELGEQVGIEAEGYERNGRLYAVLNEVKLPPGVFNQSATDVLFIADLQYPLSAMDMFWTDPFLLRADGSVPVGAKWIEEHLDRDWRRFSWHRQGPAQRHGNLLLGHYSLMEARFASEPVSGTAA
jgi:hypothetical protein